MRRCERCGVEVSGELAHCPLCQGELVGEASPSVFPSNEVKRSGALALRVLAFATGVAVVAMLFLGARLPLPRGVATGTSLALLANYALVRQAVTRAPDFLRLLARYFLALLALSLAWLVLTGWPAIAELVVPIVCLSALVTDAVLVCVFRGTFVSGYAKYLLLDVLFGLVPLALAGAGVARRDVLCWASALVACVLLIALLAFARDRLLAEVRKLFAA